MGSLVGYIPWGCKESDMTEQLTHTHRRYPGKGVSPSGGITLIVLSTEPIVSSRNSPACFTSVSLSSDFFNWEHEKVLIDKQ